MSPRTRPLALRGLDVGALLCAAWLLTMSSMRPAAALLWPIGLLVLRVLLEERAPAWLRRPRIGVCTAGVVAGAATGVAAAGAWALRYPRTDYPAGPMLALGALAAGAVLALIPAMLVSLAARPLRALGILRAEGGAARLAFLLSCGTILAVADRVDPTLRWTFPPGATPALALAAGFGLFAIVAIGLVGLGCRPRTRKSLVASVLLLAVAALIVGLGAPGDLPAGAPREGWPEAVLLITIDTLRADHLGGYGYARETSPQIDALAAQSVLYERAYATMPSTDPSHVSMLTGLHPRSSGVMANGLPVTRSDTVTLASWFLERGYRTGAITSRAHLNPDSLRLPGFQTYSAPVGRKGASVAQEALRRALRWLDRHGDAPFFLWVHFWDPHGPYDPPAGPERAMFDGGYRGAFVKRGRPGGPPADEPYAPGDLRDAIGLYDGEIRYTDTRVGALIEDVRARCGEGNVLVVLAADHGETFGELDATYGYALDHGKILARQELHVPLMFSWPGRLPAGLRVSTPVSVASLAPTVAALLGGEIVADVPPLELGKATNRIDPPSPVFAERARILKPTRSYLSVPEHALVHGPRLYVENARRGRFLFDMEEDPDGRTNRAGREPDVVDRFHALILEFVLRFPMIRVDLGALEGDRLEALRGLGYHGGR